MFLKNCVQSIQRRSKSEDEKEELKTIFKCENGEKLPMEYSYPYIYFVPGIGRALGGHIKKLPSLAVVQVKPG